MGQRFQIIVELPEQPDTVHVFHNQWMYGRMPLWCLLHLGLYLKGAGNLDREDTRNTWLNVPEHRGTDDKTALLTTLFDLCPDTGNRFGTCLIGQYPRELCSPKKFDNNDGFLYIKGCILDSGARALRYALFNPYGDNPVGPHAMSYNEYAQTFLASYSEENRKRPAYAFQVEKCAAYIERLDALGDIIQAMSSPELYAALPAYAADVAPDTLPAPKVIRRSRKVACAAG